MSRAFLSPSARRDLLEIFYYIREDNPPAALAFVRKLRERCDFLARFPAMGSMRDDLLPGLRCLTVRNYVLYFRASADGIEIVRVLHGARDAEVVFKEHAENEE